MKINLISYDDPKNNGVNRYAQTLHAGLNKFYGKTDEIEWTKIHKYEIHGHFGLVSVRFLSALQARNYDKTDINHAVSTFLDAKAVNVITLHDVSFLEHHIDYTKKYVSYNKKHIQKLLLSNKKFIVPSNVVRDMVLRNFDVSPEKVVAIHHGIEQLSDDYKNSLQNPYKDEKIHIVILGGLDHIRRKFDKILERVRDTNYEVYVIGYGNNPVYDTFRSSTNIHFLGYLDDHSVHEYVKFSDLVAYNSVDEGFGYIPLEVFNLGGRVLTNEAPIFREICQDYAYYYNPNFSNFSEMLQLALHSNVKDVAHYV
ncbi:MAG: glycosyltransferase, partial [Thermoplasmatales archaeon]